MSEAVDIPAAGFAATRRPIDVALLWRRAVPLLLTAPLLLFMLVLYAVPVLSMLMRSVNDPAWTLSNYASLARDTVFLKVFLNTLYTSLIVTLGTLLLGYPLALSLVRARRIGHR